MSQKERERLNVLHRLDKGDIRCVDAAECLGICERQLYRLRDRYHRDGDEGLIHRLRGCLSNRGYSRKVRTKVLELYRERYSDYGPTLFAEMIAQKHSDNLPPVNHETLRRWLLKSSLWTAARTRKAHRRKRDRREKIGSLVQFDGSDHDWFEGRGPCCCLLVAIDDASGRVFMRFARSENAQDVLLTLRRYIERYGIPREIYTDKANVYHPPSKGERLTDVGRALTRLGVRMIVAHSPQAKGRVERSNRTHQDRLVKALRRHNISTIEAANKFLEHIYLKEHNNRFASLDKLKDIHRPSEGLDFNNIFCFETTRCVYNDYTITLHSQFIQLEKSTNGAPLPPPGSSVILRKWLDNSLHIFWNDQELNFTFCPSKSRRPLPHHNPGLISAHPWRHKPLIGKARYRSSSKNVKLKRKSKQNIVS
jgi:transposase-like protein